MTDRIVLFFVDAKDGDLFHIESPAAPSTGDRISITIDRSSDGEPQSRFEGIVTGRKWVATEREHNGVSLGRVLHCVVSTDVPGGKG